MNPYSAHTSVACGSPAAELWGVLTDTERLNRVMGMARITLEPLSDASAARHVVTTRLGGFAVQFEERPFEWVYPTRYRVLRRMRSGPLTALEVGYTLAPEPGGGTTVTVRLTLTPRYRALSALLPLMAGRTLRGFHSAIQHFDRELQAGRPVRLAPRGGAIHEGALHRATAALRPEAPPELVDRLASLILEGDDVAVGRIRPFQLADAWQVDRRDLLGTCLAAVRAGLLELNWEVICPSCRTATEAIPTLAGLADHATCQLCEIRFAIDLDEAIEATFMPSAAVRTVDLGPYCIGGPSRTPHVLVQAILPPGTESRLTAPTEEGRYRLFLRGGTVIPLEVRNGAHPIGEAVSGDGAGSIQVAPGGEVRVRNPSAGEIHAKIERVTFTDQAARARIVTTMPGFRRDFSQDILRPGMALRVARVGLFFSDLTGSTQLYTDAGDATAFKLVQDHFEIVVASIESTNGTLVKTIGDAVMAAFADDLDALRASITILHAFDDFRRGDATRQKTNIKLGVYGGSCYVVTANNVLDYFGQTVNIAARLQGEAHSGELVVTAELADQALAQRLLPETFIRERYAAHLKGVAAPIAVVRIRVGD